MFGMAHGPGAVCSLAAGGGTPTWHETERVADFRRFVRSCVPFAYAAVSGMPAKSKQSKRAALPMPMSTDPFLSLRMAHIRQLALV